MANPEQLAKLEEGVEAWNQWRRSQAITPDLSGADFSDKDLSRADLRGVNFSESNLSGSTLRESNLQGAVLRGSDLRGVNFTGSNPSGASLREANLHCICSPADLASLLSCPDFCPACPLRGCNSLVSCRRNSSLSLARACFKNRFGLRSGTYV